MLQNYSCNVDFVRAFKCAQDLDDLVVFCFKVLWELTL